MFYVLIFIVAALLLTYLVSRKTADECTGIIGEFLYLMSLMGYIDESESRSFDITSEKSAVLLRRRIYQKWREHGLDKKCGPLPRFLADEAVSYYESGVLRRQSHITYRGKWELPELTKALSKRYEELSLSLKERAGIIEISYGESRYIGGPGASFARTRKISRRSGHR